MQKKPPHVYCGEILWGASPRYLAWPPAREPRPPLLHLLGRLGRLGVSLADALLLTPAVWVLYDDFTWSCRFHNVFLQYTLKTLDECEIVSWRVYVSVELTRQNSLSFSEYHVFVGTCAWSGNQSFMDPFLIVRKYSLVEYIMNAHRVKWVNYSTKMWLC